MRLIAGFFLLLGVAAAARCLCAGAPAAQAAGQSLTELPMPSAFLEWRGSTSCAAAACHNGNTSGGVRGREYAIWVTRDPHRSAYGVLYDDRSAGIERNLRRTAAMKAWKDARCLNCHVHPGIDAALDGLSSLSDADAQQAGFLSDGVGCESCHGASGRWRSEHYTAAWRQKSDAEKQQLGMQPTKNLRARAQLCAGCHVGAPGREVDHDLLAAGHPRLSFEFAAFLANLPKHWDDAAERQTTPDLEARAWTIGQAVSAAAAVRLLEEHARGHGAWPELAGYDCFACHHDLQQTSWRTSRDRRTLSGTPRWGDWYLSPAGMSVLKRQDAEAAAVLTQLQRKLSESNPAGAEIIGPARAAERALGNWLADSDRYVYDAAGLHNRLTELVRSARPAELSWDQAAQLYLGLAALYQAEGDLGRGRLDAHLRDSLGAMVRQLEFPAAAQADQRYDSPVEQRRGDRQEKFREALSDFERSLAR